jgi:hypothetical protein
MQKRTVLIALGVGLGLMTLLFVLSYASTGQGALAGIGRIVVVALVGYLVLQGRGWASFLLALWFGLMGFVLIVGAVGVGGTSQIVMSLVFAAAFFWSTAVMWRTRKHGIAPAPTAAVAPGSVADGSSGV